MGASRQDAISSQNKNDLIGQKIILTTMKFLGYDDVRHGFCYGIASKKLEAIILGKTSVKDADGKVHDVDQLEIYEQRIQKIFAIYEKYIKKYFEEKQIKDYLFCWNRSDYLDGIEHFYGDRKQAFLTAIQEDIEKLSPDEQKKEKQSWIDIQAFFDGVALTQSGRLFSHLYEGNWTQEQELRKSISLSASLGLEAKQGLIEVDTQIGCYSLFQLTDYFKTLRNALKKNNLKSNIGFNLLSKTHAICFGYDPIKQIWILGDPNNAIDKPIPLENEDGTSNDLNMAKKIMSYLVLKQENEIKDNDNIIFSTHVYMTGQDYKNETKVESSSKITTPSFIQDWRNSNEMQNIHVIDNATVSKVDMLGNRLLGQAFFENDFKMATDIIALLPEDQLIGGLNLSLAYEKFENITEFLKKDVDIEKAIGPFLKNPTSLTILERYLSKLEETMAQDPEINLRYASSLDNLRVRITKNKEEINDKLTRYSLTMDQAKKLPSEITDIFFLDSYNSFSFALVKFPEYTRLIFEALPAELYQAKDEEEEDDLLNSVLEASCAISVLPIITQGIDWYKPFIKNLDRLVDVLRALPQEQTFEFLSKTLGIDFIKPLLLEARDHSGWDDHSGNSQLLEYLPEDQRFIFLTDTLGIEFVKLITEDDDRRNDILKTLVDKDQRKMLEHQLQQSPASIKMIIPEDPQPEIPKANASTKITNMGYAKFGVFGVSPISVSESPVIVNTLDTTNPLSTDKEKPKGP